MATVINSDHSSIQAIAEVILGRLEPEMKDLGAYEFEDIIEDVKNAYLGVVWKVYLQTNTDGDRLIIESLLQRKRYKVEGSSVVLEGISIVDLPRDAGVYQVLSFDKDNNIVGEPLTKTNPASAYAPASRINPGYRYYRIGDTMYFPDGLPACGVGVDVIFLGLLNDNEIQYIPRDMADMTRDKVWASLAPSKNIRADITNNKNPNE